MKKKLVTIWLLVLIKSTHPFEQFDNILLIINYNHPHYNTIPFLQNLYKPYFSNIVFYGPQKHPDVHQCFHNKGYHSYRAIIHAMQKYPDYEGYFFVQDDCIIHPWFLEKKDLTKIWYIHLNDLQKDTHRPISVETSKIVHVFNGKNAYNWSWWKKSVYGHATIANVYKHLAPEYKAMLAQNWGNENILAAFSDLVYIPAAYKDDFINVSTLMSKSNTFLELALPTTISCISDHTQWEKLYGHDAYHYPFTNDIESYPANADFVHPVKCSIKENQSILQKIFP